MERSTDCHLKSCIGNIGTIYFGGIKVHIYYTENNKVIVYFIVLILQMREISVPYYRQVLEISKLYMYLHVFTCIYKYLHVS